MRTAKSIKASNASLIVFSGSIGALVFSELFSIAVAAVLLAYSVADIPLSGGVTAYSAYIMLADTTVILGVCVGAWSFIRKSVIFQKVLTSVSWEMALVNVALSGTAMLVTFSMNIVLSGVASFAANMDYAFYYLSGGVVLNLYDLLIAPATLAAFFMFFYPFSCLVVFLYRQKTTRAKTQRKAMALATALAFALNPIFVFIPLETNHWIEREAFYEPCGTDFSGFTENSPARDAGMSVGEVIASINGTMIKEVRDLEDFMAALNSSAPLRVKTLDSGVYSVSPYLDNVSNRYTLGITGVTTVWCLKDEEGTN